MRKRLVISLVVIALSCGLSSAIASDVLAASSSINPDDNWTIPSYSEVGTQGIVFFDQELNIPSSYLLKDIHERADGFYDKDPTCSGWIDTNCNFASGETHSFRADLPVCETAQDINCIETVGATPSGESETVGMLSSYFPAKGINDFVGKPEWHLPTGTTGSLWKIPGAPHAGGDLYYVNFTITGSLLSAGSQGKVLPTTENLQFSASISPVKLNLYDRGCAGLEPFYNGPKSGPGSSQMCTPGIHKWYSNVQDLSSLAGWGWSAPGYGEGEFCVERSDGYCAQKFSFPNDFRFALKVRTNLDLGGWTHGRMKDPVLQITKSAGTSSFRIEAAPVRVPLLNAGYAWDKLPELLKPYYKSGDFIDGELHGGSITRIADRDRSDPYTRAMTSTPLASGEAGLRELRLWLPYFKDQASASNPLWNIRSLNNQEMQGSNSCFSDRTKINGIVTTNSTEYSAGPPKFNSDTGQLTYTVSSPHFTSSGAIFYGTYDLLMTSEVARCVYKFSKAPISASIEITGEDGEVHVATTSFSEADGWVALHAKNFTYSSPILRAKLTQERAQVTLAPKDSVANKVNSALETLLSEGAQYFLNNLNSSPNGIPFKGKDTSCVVVLTKDAAIRYPQSFPSQVVRESDGVSGRIIFNYQPGNYHVTFCGDDLQTVNFQIVAGSDPLNPVMAQPTKGTAPASLIKKSITCMKGKTVKKVTAVNPKCPVGYKQK